eukprot:CAMPEP_0182590022 /NCGR_PEP_ID=MMETSP1324-20130603/70776_1 /TAXON_ID=236786 /ORGANISM="Florenciella sp., Strain RCC1587" /LENGTH=80 /DNA_ID=CAMNT_0024807213 /DNA_START=309 /DNA_END=551 /DNA_ORIENTATION=-
MKRALLTETQHATIRRVQVEPFALLVDFALAIRNRDLRVRTQRQQRQRELERRLVLYRLQQQRHLAQRCVDLMPLHRLHG